MKHFLNHFNCGKLKYSIVPNNNRKGASIAIYEESVISDLDTDGFKEIISFFFIWHWLVCEMNVTRDFLWSGFSSSDQVPMKDMKRAKTRKIALVVRRDFSDMQELMRTLI